MTNPERWVLVPGYSLEYQVSNLGRVRSWYMGGSRRRLPRIKIPQMNKNGYLYVVLSRKKVIKAWTIHRLVLTAFTEPHSSKIDACHNDGNKTNNHLSNLRWATRKENEADKLIHGTRAIGDRNGMRKRKLCSIQK